MNALKLSKMCLLILTQNLDLILWSSITPIESMVVGAAVSLPLQSIPIVDYAKLWLENITIEQLKTVGKIEVYNKWIVLNSITGYTNSSFTCVSILKALV